MKFRYVHRLSLILSFFFLCNINLQSQGQLNWQNGYVKYNHGWDIDYHSCHPEANLGLLIRCLDDTNYIEWTTAAVPQDYKGDKVTLKWIGGYAVNTAKGSRTFPFYINDKFCFNIKTSPEDKREQWTISNENATLSFKLGKIDNAGDFFGYYSLTVPVSYLSADRALKIKIKGDGSGSRDWYMTMRYPLIPQIRINPEQAVRKEVNGKLSQQIKVSIDNFGDPVPAKIYTEGSEAISSQLVLGVNDFHINIEEPKQPVQKEIKIEVDGKTTTHNVTVSPVKRFTFYLIPAAHVDIGYTTLQHEVEKKHWKNYDNAIEYSKRSANYPAGSVFKWNVESLWAVKSYLEEFPGKRAQFIEAVRKGWINLDADYANMLTGLCRPEELYKMVDYSNILENETGVKIESAMISDIPGYAWGIVQAFADNGIKYFSVGPNEFDRIGNTLSTWGDKPFYWKSPSGNNKVLVWLAGKGYSWFHHWQISRDDLEPLYKYIDQLEAQKYPYDIVHVRYNIGGDNGFPDSLLAGFVKNWNETHETPKFVISSNVQMFKDFETKYGSQIPVESGDFTPYWEDGAGSTAKETALNRNAAELLTQLDGLYTCMNVKNYPQAEFDEAWKNVLLFSEHTWGAWNSISDPADEFVKGQWEIKKSFVLKADSLAHKLYNDLAFTAGKNAGNVKTVSIYNTSSWERSDIVSIPAAVKTAGDFVTDEKGKPISSQRLTTGELVFDAKDIPAYGYRKFNFSEKKLHGKSLPVKTENGASVSLENKYYRVAFNKETGAINKIEDKGNKYDYSGSGNNGLNGFIYTGRNAANPQTNGAVKIIQKESGPVLSSVAVESSAPGCNNLVREIKLFSDFKKIEIVNTIDKKDIYDKENLRFSFPFNIQEPVTRLDIAWSVIRPELDQLAGANKNYYTVERWVDISNDKFGATLACVDAPLVEVGGLNAEAWLSGTGDEQHWAKTASSSSLIYSWVMNNSWHTNFKASQEGVASFRYELLPHNKFDFMKSYRFGVEQSQPLLVIYSDLKTVSNPLSVKVDESSKAVVTSFKPARNSKSYIVRLYNPTNEKSSTWLKLNLAGKYGLLLSNGDEQDISMVSGKIELGPFEVKTIKIIPGK